MRRLAIGGGVIIGIAACSEPRTPLARPGQGVASARTARASLRLVHRGVRHARPEGGEGAAGGVVLKAALTLKTHEAQTDRNRLVSSPASVAPDAPGLNGLMGSKRSSRDNPPNDQRDDDSHGHGTRDQRA